MPYLDELYSPEEAPAQQQLPESDFFGRGSAITEHIARTPGLAREMRYSPSLAQRQDMQNYLGPLAAQDFAADARRSGDVGGMVAAAGAPVYAIGKAVAPGAVSRATGTGEALTSEASLDQVARAYRGLGQPSASEVRAMLAARQGPEALQREVVAAQVPYTAGRVQFGNDPAWWQAGGNFTPNDVLPTAAAALGGVAGLARSGAPGLAWEAVKQGGSEAAKRYLADPAERMFDTARGFIGGPDGGWQKGLLKALAGVGAVGGAIEGAKWFAKEAPNK